MNIEIDSSDLQKIYDALFKANSYFQFRDHMNAVLHISATRSTPLASLVEAEKERLGVILIENNIDTAQDH